MTAKGARDLILHASSVALSGRGCLILGPSGSGKSSLALQLMAMGCDLVSDDRTIIRARDGGLIATAPEAIRGKIEARGVGLLAAAPAGAARLVFAIDLARREPDRLPPWRIYSALGVDLPLLHMVESAHFAAAILQYLKAGRAA